MMVRVRQMLMRLRHRLVMGAFELWVGAVTASEIALLVAEKAAARATFHIDMQAADELMNRRVMISASQRLHNRGLTRCIVSWQAWTLQKVATRSILRTVMKRIQSMTLSRVLLSWQHHARRAAHIHRLAEVALRRIGSLALAYGFDAMASWACKMKRVRVMMGRCRDGLMHSAFVEWSEVGRK